MLEQCLAGICGVWRMNCANRRSARCLPEQQNVVFRWRAAYTCLNGGIVLTAGIFSTAVMADIPALCAPAKARHDKAMASGERGAVLAARDRIKALAGACPQLWAAVRNASLPPLKEQAKAAQAGPKKELKPQSPKLDKLTQSLLKQGYRLFAEPTISQPATTYVGDGDPVSSGRRWFLWRTQEGCYFYIDLPDEGYETKGLSLHKKKWTFRVGQFRWKGQCTPGKLIKGWGTLEEEERAEGEVALVGTKKTYGEMTNGLWNGVTHFTRTTSPDWPGVNWEYRMGCNVNAAIAPNCRSPRVPRELIDAGGQ